MEYVVIKNKHLWLKLAFYPTDWGWVWKPGIINCGPFCAWWITDGADQLATLPRNWDKPFILSTEKGKPRIFNSGIKGK